MKHSITLFLDRAHLFNLANDEFFCPVIFDFFHFPERQHGDKFELTISARPFKGALKFQIVSLELEKVDWVDPRRRNATKDTRPLVYAFEQFIQEKLPFKKSKRKNLYVNIVKNNP